MSSREDFLRREIYDMAVSVGSLMTEEVEYKGKRKKRVDKSTLNNMISLFLYRGNVREALNELVIYIARQIGRKEIPRYVGQKLIGDILRIYDQFKDDEKGLGESMSKYLIMARWVYESNIEGVKSLRELMEKIAKGR